MQSTITVDKEKYIEEKMKKFRLGDMRKQYADIIAEAENEKIGYKDFLIRLLAVEDAGKTLRRTEMLLEKARFDTVSNLDDISEELELDELKEIAINLLDKNILYSSFSDIECNDELSDDDKAFTKSFYNVE